MTEVKKVSNIHLLMVDDDPENLAEERKWLNRFGYEHIASAESAKEAREKLEQGHYDIIVADMRMEADDSGFLVVEEVKKRNLSSVVIILTANDTVADCRKAFKMGAWDYISKNMRGASFTPLIKVRFEKMAGQDVCAIEVKKATRAAFLRGNKGKEFYIRVGNGSRSLDIEETLNYIQMHSE